jgi:hypothetical protein
VIAIDAVAVLLVMGVVVAVGVGTMVTILTKSARSSNSNTKSAAWTSSAGGVAIVALLFVTRVVVGRARRGILIGNPNNANPWVRTLAKSVPKRPSMFSSTRVAGTNRVSMMVKTTNNTTRLAMSLLTNRVINEITAGE